MASTPITIEDLRVMRDEIWTETDPQYPGLHRWRTHKGDLTPQGKKRFRHIFRAAAIISYNFTVSRYDWGGFSECICNECGHRLSFNDQSASWARKHRAKHLGVYHFQVENTGHALMEVK